MRMKGKILIAMFLVCATSSTLVLGVFAQVGGLGVKAGDNFTYSFEAYWSSTNPSVVVPTQFSDLNKTRSININVTDVGPTIAYLNITNRMIDATNNTYADFIEVSHGRYAVGSYGFIIGANLTTGDVAYPLAENANISFTITDTRNATYLGISREVNYYHEQEANEGVSVTRDAYYDRATGILLELTISHSAAVSAEDTETDSEHWKIIQFNEASTPSDGTDDGTDGTDLTGAIPEWILYAAIIAVAVVVAALVAVLVLRRRKSPKAQAPAESPVQSQPPV